MISAVENAVLDAFRERFTSQENLRAELDKDSGKIRIFAVKQVVARPAQIKNPALQVGFEEARKIDPKIEIGDDLQIPKSTDGILDKSAAQLAKQAIFAKVREAELTQRLGKVNQPSVKSASRTPDAHTFTNEGAKQLQLSESVVLTPLSKN